MSTGPSTQRITIAGIAVSLALLCWATLVLGPSAPMGNSFNAVTLLLFIGVWAVGMVAMMLPSLLPMIYMVVSASKKSLRDRGTTGGPRTLVKPLQFVLGYFGIWSFVGVAAFLGLTFLFQFYAPYFGMGGGLVGLAAGVAVFLAGVYQFSPLKQRALRACRSPMNFVMTRWKEGRAAGFLMGLDYGFFCTKCCWAFMAVMVVVGGMSILWMVLFAGVIFVEKIAPRGVIVSWGLGILLMVAGVGLAALPS